MFSLRNMENHHRIIIKISPYLELDSVTKDAITIIIYFSGKKRKSGTMITVLQSVFNVLGDETVAWTEELTR